MRVQIKVLDKEFYLEHKLPHYQTAGSCALDLIVTKDVTIWPRERKMIPTGLAIWIGPMGIDHMTVAGVILPRSGLGIKGLVLANTVGVIDSDYQGELVVSALNSLQSNIVFDYKDADFSMDTGLWENVEEEEINKIELKAGDRFAQLMFVPVCKPSWALVDEFSEQTDRGAGGFGHSGE